MTPVPVSAIKAQQRAAHPRNTWPALSDGAHAEPGQHDHCGMRPFSAASSEIRAVMPARHPAKQGRHPAQFPRHPVSPAQPGSNAGVPIVADGTTNSSVAVSHCPGHGLRQRRFGRRDLCVACPDAAVDRQGNVQKE